MGEVGINFCRAMSGLLLLVFLAGCATQRAEVATPPVTASPALQNTPTVRSRQSSGAFDLLYVTDRAPVTASDSTLSYGAERAMFLSFGSVSVTPTRNSPTSELRVGVISGTGQFPATPYGVVATANGLHRTPRAVAAHDQAAASLQADVARRLATADRKEVVVFIHGYGNSFDDAARATGEICRSLQNQFACIVLTWPAGGSGGFFFGYNIDRESSEFAVADFKKAIRIIAEAKGVERLHLLAHSRGTDVLASVVQQLAIEAYVSRSSLWQRYKIANAVFFAPDIDLDVASSKLFAWVRQQIKSKQVPASRRHASHGLFVSQRQGVEGINTALRQRLAAGAARSRQASQRQEPGGVQMGRVSDGKAGRFRRVFRRRLHRPQLFLVRSGC